MDKKNPMYKAVEGQAILIYKIYNIIKSYNLENIIYIKTYETYIEPDLSEVSVYVTLNYHKDFWKLFQKLKLNHYLNEDQTPHTFYLRREQNFSMQDYQKRSLEDTLKSIINDDLKEIKKFDNYINEIKHITTLFNSKKKEVKND